MKFCKKYEEYMQGQGQGQGRGQRKLPGVGFKKLKKILKRCRGQIHSHKDRVHGLDDHQIGDGIPHDSSTCPQLCPVCDGSFFPSLLEEMSAVVGFFNERAQKLLELHLASGFSKCFIWLKDKMQGNHVTLIQEGRELVTYAIINAIAMRKILKKYDKIHYSKQGQVFKSQAQSMHIEILQSPWLCELMAFHINLRDSKANSKVDPPLFGACSLVFDDGKPSLSCELMAFHINVRGSKVNSKAASPLLVGCSLVFDDGNPSLSCELFDSVKLEIDLTCCICLETFFEPVSLTCGHIFCYMCACKASSVTIVDGLKAANLNKKCPICRESGVYESAVHLEELHILLSRSCPDYWKERRKAEKIERVKQTKEHWESQCRLFMGV